MIDRNDIEARLRANCARVKVVRPDAWKVSCPLPHHGQGDGDVNPSVSVTIAAKTRGDDAGSETVFIKCHGLTCDQDEVFHAIMGIDPAAPKAATPTRGQRVTIDWPDHVPCAAGTAGCPGAAVAVTQTDIVEWPAMACSCGESSYADLLNLAAASKHGISCRWRYAYDGSGDEYAWAIRKCQPDGSKHCSGNGTNSGLLLGKLEPITAHPGMPVVITEGEKAAVAAFCAGLSSATWRGGTSAVGHAVFDTIRGRDVILWPDNDDPGRYAMNAAGKLAQDAGANSVRIIAKPIPNLPDKGDAADLPAGAVKDALALAEPFVFVEHHPDPTKAKPVKTTPKTRTPREVWETRDLDWLINSGCFCIRISGNSEELMTRRPDGRWRAIPSMGKSLPRANITWLLSMYAPHRQDIDPDDPPPRSDNHWVRVISRLFDEMSPLEEIQSTQFNRPLADGPGVLPMKSGGGWDVKASQHMPADDMSKLRLSVPWQIPDHNPDAVVDENDPNVKLIKELVTGPLLPLAEAIAYGLAWTGKGIILLKWAARNTGKSTLATKAMFQMNSAVYHIAEIRSLTTEGGFTGELSQVAIATVLILDEVDKIVTPIQMPDIERFCVRDAEIHQKKVDPYRSPRTSCGIWMGNDWPNLPWGHSNLTGPAGDRGRADFAPILIDIPNDEARKYTGEESNAILGSIPAGIWLQQWLLERAGRFANAGMDFYDNASPVTQAAIDAGRAEIQELQDNAVAAKQRKSGETGVASVVARMVFVGGDKNFVTVEEIKAALGGEGRQIPAAFKTQLKKKFPKIAHDDFHTGYRNPKGARSMKGWLLLDQPPDDPGDGTYTCDACQRDTRVGTGANGKCAFCAEQA